LPRVVAAATTRARQILAAAERQAETIREGARREAAATRLQAETTGRADGAARVAAWAVKLARLEAQADRRALERSIQLAALLAERLLRRALDLDPSLVALLAEQALAEARGARRITLAVHPTDAAALESYFEEIARDSVTVQHDDTLGRGDIRLETELGVLDARLEPQLERLAKRLKDTLTP
jgi:flagellar biosynthesis/type III secretory pathway protein FliH